MEAVNNGVKGFMAIGGAAVAAPAVIIAGTEVGAGALITQGSRYLLQQGGRYMLNGAKSMLRPNAVFNWRAAVADAVYQWGDKGSLSKVNPIRSIANGFFANPLTQSIPGAFVDLSQTAQKKGDILSNPRDWNVYNNILWNTAGNIFGDYAQKYLGGNGSGTGAIFGEYMGNAFGSTGEPTTKNPDPSKNDEE